MELSGRLCLIPPERREGYEVSRGWAGIEFANEEELSDQDWHLPPRIEPSSINRMGKNSMLAHSRRKGDGTMAPSCDCDWDGINPFGGSGPSIQLTLSASDSHRISRYLHGVPTSSLCAEMA